MHLIVDSGSTKGDWRAITGNEVILQTRTPGLNPAVLSDEEIIRRISDNKELVEISSKISRVFFYGAGCGTRKPKTRLKNILTSIFAVADISVFEDTQAAVRSVTSTKGIICILGTGSNSCYFDGENIHQPVASLGYKIMDEAGGFYFGRELIRDYFYQKMPESVAREFKNRFHPDPDEIKFNLYQKPHPNAYVASFASFMFMEEIRTLADTYFYDLIKKGIATFIDCRILSFETAHELPIHFVGSIAYFAKEIIEECLQQNNLKLGNIIRHPIDGLISYHQSKFDQ